MRQFGPKQTTPAELTQEPRQRSCPLHPLCLGADGPGTDAGSVGPTRIRFTNLLEAKKGKYAPPVRPGGTLDMGNGHVAAKGVEGRGGGACS